MQETYNTKAIVLNKQDFRERDSLVTVYSMDKGKMNLVARGTKNVKSKLSGHIEPMNLIDLMVVRGKNFDYVGSPIARNSFLNIKRDLEKIKVAGKAINYFSSSVGENDGGEFFDVLVGFLSFLNQELRIKNQDTLISEFILKLLSRLGYRPELSKCVECGSKANDKKIVFDFLRGGLVCEKCLKKSLVLSRKLTLSFGCVNVLNIILDSNYNEFKEEKKITVEAVNFICTFDKFCR